MAKFKAGKAGRTQIVATNMTNKGWTISLDAMELDTSNFESGGKKSYLIGLEGLAWTIEANFDAAKNPLDDPPGFYMRDDGVTMKLYTNVANNRFWSMPTWMCSKCDMGVTVAGLVTFNASGKAQEDFALITGSNP
jgi:hypothetical protein